jgi:hypothetical protein
MIRFLQQFETTGSGALGRAESPLLGLTALRLPISSAQRREEEMRAKRR